MMKKMQVDRFEEHLAVLTDDDMNILNVTRDFFSFELHEGDILALEFEGETLVSAHFLAEETQAAKARTKALMDRIRNKKKRS